MKVIALVLTAVLTTTATATAQCYGPPVVIGPPIYVSPPVYCPPTVSETRGYAYDNAIYHNIHNTGHIYTKDYVRVKTPEGIIEVPVINGILPRYNEHKYASGKIVRDFYYDTGVRWSNNGKMPVYGNDVPKPRTTPAPTPRTTPAPVPRTTPSPRLEFRESPGLDELRRDNNSLKQKNQELEDRLKKLGGEVDKLKNQPTPPPVLPKEPEKKSAPLEDVQRLEKSVTDLKGELEVIRTLSDQSDANQKQIKAYEAALDELRSELAKLKDQQKVEAKGLPPIIDPSTAIPRNETPRMQRPSEIK